MRGIAGYLLYCFIFAAACHQPAPVAKKMQPDSIRETSIPPGPVILPPSSEDSSIINKLKRRMEVIDDSIYYYQKVRRYVQGDSLQMDLYIFKKRPVKLVYSKQGTYYFDHQGDVFARHLFWSEENITGEFFLKYNTVISFNTTIYTNNWKLRKLDVVAAMERKAGCVKELDSLMKKFPKVSYKLR